MKSKNLVLLKTLLKATSLWNIRKYSTDRKKRSRAVASFFGIACLEIMLVVYSYLAAVGFAMAGAIEAVPSLSVLSVSGIAFIFTIFKTNGYLFNFKEYDMLMALPFKVKDVAACKFMYMYVKSIKWYLGISLPMMAGYIVFSKASLLVGPMWLVLSIFVPIIPMLAASFVGFLIARISAGFEKKNIVQTILSLIFVMFCFSFRYILDALIKNDQLMDIARQTSDLTKNIDVYYFPAGLFNKAVTDIGSFKWTGMVYGLLLIVLTMVLFEVVFILVGKNYRQINSALKSHVAKKSYRMTGQKKKSVLNTIAFKEFKRMAGSTTYFVNAALGHILALVAGVAVLIMGMDKIVGIVTQGAPIPQGILNPAIPLIVYFLVGMMATTCCSPSLEGKNYWIMQSLPLEKKTIYQGKMLFNMYLAVPVMTFTILCFCISAGTSLLETILYLVLGVALCGFSTAWGCVCGIKHMRLDWENEVEVIKQSTAVSIYLLPNMFVTMGLVVLVVWLGTFVSPVLVTAILILVAGVLAGLSYLRVMKLVK